MESPTLENLIAVNEELAALIDAGIPLEVGLGRNNVDAANTLEIINADVAGRVERGASLTESLEQADQVAPNSYRWKMLYGIHCRDLSAALENSQAIALSADEAAHAMRSAVAYPLLVCFLAYLGLAGFCVFFVPTLANTYDGLQLSPGQWLSVLQSMSATLPYWIGIPPLILLLVLVWRARIRTGGGGIGWLPAVTRVSLQEKWASFAEILAELLDAGVTLRDGLELAIGASDDGRIAKAVRAFRDEEQGGDEPQERRSSNGHLPPLLRWAMAGQEASGEHSLKLRTAAQVYRSDARRGQQRLQLTLPLVLCVVLGGTATLFYGLALFLPVVELYRAVAPV